MRLFKRYTLDTSPQLVSAVPISQDVATTNDVGNKALEKPEKKSKSAVNDGTGSAASIKECTDTQKESTDSSVLTRKGRNVTINDIYGDVYRLHSISSVLFVSLHSVRIFIFLQYIHPIIITNNNQGYILTDIEIHKRYFNVGTESGSTMGSDKEIGQYRIAFGIATTTTLESTSEEL